jgi:uncharacterized cupredoxin-like copper-binding protein
MRMEGRLRRTLVVAVSGYLVMGGCDARPPALGTPGTSDSPRAVNVIMRDFLFEPRPIRLFPGETVRFTVVNAGLVAHDFVLGGADVQAAWSAADAAATPPIIGASPPPASAAADTGGVRVWVASGGTGNAVYEVPAATEAQRLQLACRIPGHAEEGMVAELVIEP